MKKFFSLLLTLALVLSLAACGGGNGGSDAGTTTPPTADSGDTQTPPPAEDVTITVAALASGYEEAYPGMWQEVCDAFTAETGVKVNLICDKNLEDVIGPSMQGGDFPDVIHLATGREKGLTEQFIKDRNIAELTDVLSMTIPGESTKVSDKIVGGFTDTSVTNPYGDGVTYLAPMFYSPCGLFYNAGLFEEKGWTVPATWDEMWELAEKAQAEGSYLFTYPTTGYFDAFLYALMYSVGGPDFFNKATTYAEGIWDTPEAQQCFDIIAKLASYTNPVTPAQANDQDFTQNQQLVLDNKALFMPNGTWIVGEMAEAPRAEGFQWGMTALPAAKAGGNGASYCWLEQAWIPAQAANIDAAKQFIKFMCDSAHTVDAVQAARYFAVRNSAEGTDLSTIWADNAIMNEYTKLMPFLGDYYQVTTGWAGARTEWWNMLQEVGAGNDIAQSVANHVAAANTAAG